MVKYTSEKFFYDLHELFWKVSIRHRRNNGGTSYWLNDNDVIFLDRSLYIGYSPDIEIDITKLSCIKVNFIGEHNFMIVYKNHKILKQINYTELLTEYKEEDYRFNLSLLCDTTQLETFISSPVFEPFLELIRKYRI